MQRRKRENGQKKRSIYISTELVLILVLLAAAVLITMLMEPHQVRTAVISAIFVVVVVYFVVSTLRKERWFTIAGRILRTALTRSINMSTPLPCLLPSQRKNGTIGWPQSGFFHACGHALRRTQYLPDISAALKPSADRKVKIGSVTYVKEVIPAKTQRERLYDLPLIDVNNTYEASGPVPYRYHSGMLTSRTHTATFARDGAERPCEDRCGNRPHHRGQAAGLRGFTSRSTTATNI